MSKIDDIINLVKESPQVLSMVYKDLAQPGVRKVGWALETVLEFSTQILLPLKLLNEKFKLNFTKNINQYKAKLEEVDDTKILNVNPQIGIPIIEKLSYVTNEEIADLFTTLLCKASNTDTLDQAHPGFVQLIERLSVDEARIIKYLSGADYVPLVSINAHLKDSSGFHIVRKNATLLQFEVDLIFPQNIDIYLDNLTSLGILNNSHGMHKTDEVLYEPLTIKYDLKALDVEYKSRGYERADFEKGYFQITNYGKQFIKAVN